MKDSVICFRINSELKAALERISTSERRSLSGAIEKILYDHIEEAGKMAAWDEKRQHARRSVSVPALVQTAGGAFAGTVRDISLGGIGISAGPGFKRPLHEKSKMSVVFTLPETSSPLLIQCEPRHFSGDKKPFIGASFAQGGHQGYASLETYLMQ